MKVRAQLAQQPVVDEELGVVWFQVRVTPEQGREEVVVQSRPHDGRSYRGGSEHLNDVLVGAVRAWERELDGRHGTARSRAMVRDENAKRLDGAAARQALVLDTREMEE